jgi:hypothetical protein
MALLIGKPDQRPRRTTLAITGGLGVVSLLALFAGCGTVHVQTASEPNFSIVNYQTFNFCHPERDPNPAWYKPEYRDYTKGTLRLEMEAHGLIMGDDPDLLVCYYLRTKNKTFDLEHPTAQGSSPAGVMKSYFGFFYGSGQSLNQQNSIPYREGTLVVDLVERKTQKVVWQGIAQGALYSKDTDEEVERRIEEAVHKIFEPFPSRPVVFANR